MKKLIVKVNNAGALTLNDNQILSKGTEIKAEALISYLEERVVKAMEEEQAEADAREKRREDVLNDLQGVVMDIGGLKNVLVFHQTTLRESWNEDRLLLYVGFGLNDGDMEFTANAEWR